MSDNTFDCPEPPMDQIVKILEGNGLEPHLIYAVKKTGMIVGPPDEKPDPHTPEQREEWLQAIEEYFELHGEEDE